MELSITFNNLPSDVFYDIFKQITDKKTILSFVVVNKELNNLTSLEYLKTLKCIFILQNHYSYTYSDKIYKVGLIQWTKELLDKLPESILLDYKKLILIENVNNVRNEYTYEQFIKKSLVYKQCQYRGSNNITISAISIIQNLFAVDFENIFK